MILPLSSSPIRGLLKLQKPNDLTSSWEFVVSDEAICNKYGINFNEVNKLPCFPRTKRSDGTRDAGIGCTLKSGKHLCVGAFHGYYAGDRYGKSYYIGSARLLLGTDYTSKFRTFISNTFNLQIGVDNQPTPVWMDFKDNNVILVNPR
jgi:hypothetical protein